MLGVVGVLLCWVVAVRLFTVLNTRGCELSEARVAPTKVSLPPTSLQSPGRRFSHEALPECPSAAHGTAHGCTFSRPTSPDDAVIGHRSWYSRLGTC